MQNNSLSFIHPDAKIGRNVTIGPFTTIYNNVEIGDDTIIGPNVTIYSGARIGQNCQIHTGAVISSVPQDLKFEGEDTVAVIGDHTVIREFVTVNRGTQASKQTLVGSHCLLMAYVHVAHDCIIGDRVILVNAVQLAGHITVGDHAVIGGASAVHQFVSIGAHVMVAGGSMILKDVPPYIMAARKPLRYDGINRRGLRRRSFSNEEIYRIQDIYRIIFQSGLNYSQAIAEVEKSIPDSTEKECIVSFFKKSSTTGRGIIKGIQK
ncbi:MAG: acyl-ACP--UDP-N-acetylglucosamine O-acyltransferase [Microscillaceae bacterium]|nr:acyl-ACP--UDP-N-acetylglucosamine O-acyltransferase [Microscillaceae bacterium]